MNKKMMKKIGAIALSITCLASASGLVACGGGGVPEGFARVDFLYCGDTTSLAMYQAAIKQFNDTKGKEEKIYVKGLPNPENAYTGTLSSKIASSSGPDVAIVTDENFKPNAMHLDDMTTKIPQNVLRDIYPRQLFRYRYDIVNTTYNDDDPLYAVPVYNDTTVLYYNKTALENQNVIVISVPEEDLAAWNNNEKADAYGKYKRDYAKLDDITVPAKGFYRNFSPFVPEDGDYEGTTWSMLSELEVAVFNDAIACNWDEIEDAGLIMTKTRNTSSPTQYGYYTEWWFNYGWSVGGDCVEDMTGNGDWVYSHPGDNANFIVNEGETYTGVYSGKTYQAGETLDLPDTLEAAAGSTINFASDYATYYHYTVNGVEAQTSSDCLEKVESGVLTQLPSIRTAFSRFCHLSGEKDGTKGDGGLNVCPYPSAFNNTSSTMYFTSGKLAFLIEQISNFDYVTKNANFEWSIAPLPIYKAYTDPTDPDCDTVAAKGTAACHSIGHAIAVRKNGQYKDLAYKFVDWFIGEGQHWLAEQGYPSSRISDKQTMMENFKYGSNSYVIANLLESSLPGDWWYMPNRAWIDQWAKPLNSNVRYGKMTFNDFIFAYIQVTNAELAAFKK